MERFERYHKKIHHGIDILLFSVNKEIEQAWTTMATFLAMFRMFLEVARSQIPTDLQHLLELKEQVKRVLDAGITDSRRLMQQLRREMPAVQHLFAAINRASTATRDEIARNPIAAAAEALKPAA